MDYTEFVAGRRLVTYPERDGTQREMLEQADTWSIFFERALVQRLECPDNGPLMEISEIHTLLNDYREWANGPLEHIINSLERYTTERSQHLLNYTNFHVMSSLFTQQWFRLLAGTSWDARAARQFNGETQDYMAILSVDMQKKRKKAGDVAQPDAVSKTRTGILSEYDVAIVELQVMKAHPELLFLPAPGSFEHGTDGSRNADFLILDMVKREIIGMQVKTAVNNTSFGRYNQGFVFLVDADIDLGDVITEKIPGKTETKIVRQPGLVAAHHMSNWPKQMDLMSSHPWLRDYVKNEQHLIGLKLYANMLTRETKNVSGLAGQRLAERTLHHLYL